MGVPIILNKKKRPLATIQSKSGQNKRFASLDKESGKAIKSLIQQHHMTTKTNQPIIYIRNIEMLLLELVMNHYYHVMDIDDLLQLKHLLRVNI